MLQQTAWTRQEMGRRLAGGDVGGRGEEWAEGEGSVSSGNVMNARVKAEGGGRTPDSGGGGGSAWQ